MEIKNNESIDNALKRFKRDIQKAGIQGELKKREYYMGPSLKRQKKDEMARKKKKKKGGN